MVLLFRFSKKNGIYILQVVGWVQVGEGVDSGDGGWFQWGRAGDGFQWGGGGKAANVRGIEGEQKANVRGA